LTLIAKIPLGEVRGRIDHLAVDVAGKRLFVAELGNDSIGVVDLASGRIQQRITGLKEPQGVGYEPTTGTLYVANAGDGSVRLFRGPGFVPAGRIDLGDDADNVRIDVKTEQVMVGFGGGGLAIIDPKSGRKSGEIRLPAHPEGFQLEPGGGRAFVNLPEARAIAIVDRGTGQLIQSVTTKNGRGNFPMALDPAGGFMAVFRSPPALISYDRDGGVRGSAETCGDADDVFVDAKRNRVYVSCGGGFIDVFDRREGGFARAAHIATMPGARTSLFVPELDRLFLAVRAQGREAPAIWEFRPEP
jgi:hypothetical protein